MRQGSLGQILAAGLFATGMLACADLLGGGDGVGNAGAQSSCPQWEVRVMASCEATCTVPEGWEPFSNHTNYYNRLWLRRCNPDAEPERGTEPATLPGPEPFGGGVPMP